MSDPIEIRAAGVSDVRAMADLANSFAERGLMLHRSHAELYERVRDFYVAVDGDEVVGVGGLRVMWANLAEVYTLAVSETAQGKGVGKRLVEAVVEEARRLGVSRVFSLTYERAFFERCGFRVVDRHANLPLKVWSECVRCPKNQACDEIAMLRVLEDVADVATPDTVDVQAVGYDVPILSETMLRIDRSVSREAGGRDAGD